MEGTEYVQAVGKALGSYVSYLAIMFMDNLAIVHDPDTILTS